MEFVTRQQFENNADANAREFANRQTLVRGTGAPVFNAPLHTEYEDDSTTPTTRYRKTGPGVLDWTDISLGRMLGISLAPDVPLVLVADDPGADFAIALPPGIPGSVAIAVEGYGTGATLSNITGGGIGQVVTLQRNETGPLSLQPGTHLKLSGPMSLDDPDMFDNIMLQRIDRDTWVELSRTTF